MIGKKFIQNISLNEISLPAKNIEVYFNSTDDNAMHYLTYMTRLPSNSALSMTFLDA